MRKCLAPCEEPVPSECARACWAQVRGACAAEALVATLHVDADAREAVAALEAHASQPADGAEEGAELSLAARAAGLLAEERWARPLRSTAFSMDGLVFSGGSEAVPPEGPREWAT